jgi:hypothetical protein
VKHSNRQRKRSRARNTCRLIIKSDKFADLQNSRRPEVSIGALFSCLFELQEATSKADRYGVGPIICLELVDDVPDMETDRRFANS